MTFETLYQDLQGVGMLEHHMRGPDASVRNLARGALWTLGVCVCVRARGRARVCACV